MRYGFARRQLLSGLGALGVAWLVGPMRGLATPALARSQGPRPDVPNLAAQPQGACKFALSQWSCRRKKTPTTEFTAGAMIDMASRLTFDAVELSTFMLETETKGVRTPVANAASVITQRIQDTDADRAKLKEFAATKKVRLLRLKVDSVDFSAPKSSTPEARMKEIEGWIDKAIVLDCDQVSLGVDTVGGYELQKDTAVRGLMRLCDYVKKSKKPNLLLLAETRSGLSSNCKWLGLVIAEVRKTYPDQCGGLLSFGKLDYNPEKAMKELAENLRAIVAEFNNFAKFDDVYRERDIDYDRYLDKKPCPGDYLTLNYIGGGDEEKDIVKGLDILKRIYQPGVTAQVAPGSTTPGATTPGTPTPGTTVSQPNPATSTTPTPGTGTPARTTPTPGTGTPSPTTPTPGSTPTPGTTTTP